MVRQKSNSKTMSPNAHKPNKSLSSAGLGHSHTVAELLKAQREKLGQTLKEVEKTTQVRKRYLELIEAADYENLPDDIYALGYVKSYADHLGFDTALITNMYKKERMSYKQQRQIAGDNLIEENMSIKPLGRQGFAIGSKSILALSSIVLFVLIIIYLGWQVVVLNAPPRIYLNANQENVTTNFVVVSGQTDRGADVYIDDSQILTNADGSFSERVALVDGPNQIKVTSKNRLGKSSYVYKNITANLPKEKTQNLNVSATTIDGVELLVKVSNQATWITIKSDGQDVFKGIMLPGTEQLFKAKSSIIMSTSNAGNTQIILSNQNVAGRDLGTVGRSGEARNDIGFSHDTQFSQTTN